MNDYVDAAERHYLSAEALLAEHAATAGHCYGISAECVLKALMSNLKVQPNRISKNHMGKHLWSEFEVHDALNGKTKLVDAAKLFKTHFGGWDVGQRYFNRRNTAFNSVNVDLQRKGAEGLRSLLQWEQKGLL